MNCFILFLVLLVRVKLSKWVALFPPCKWFGRRRFYFLHPSSIERDPLKVGSKDSHAANFKFPSFPLFLQFIWWFHKSWKSRSRLSNLFLLSACSQQGYVPQSLFICDVICGHTNVSRAMMLYWIFLHCD